MARYLVKKGFTVDRVRSNPEAVKGGQRGRV